MVQPQAAAIDGEEFGVQANGGDWLIAWHPPTAVPDGQPHGASAWCVTEDGDIVLIGNDEKVWDWPGGRPENDETWEDTLRREMLEEGCAVVRHARLLGYCRARAITGPEEGLVIVRSIWRAEVELLPWKPQFEVPHRNVVSIEELDAEISMLPGFEPIYERALIEAGLKDGTGP